MVKSGLSVTVITLNEEEYLPICLESVKSIADEIVVIDSGSSDKTVEIAKKFDAKVYIRKFDNYANQKNYASEKATGDWILSLDADEQIEPRLAKEILLAISTQKYQGYTIPRNNIILGKFIRFSRWQPELDRHVWLWKKAMGEWVGDVHEEVVVKGCVGRLKYAKIHNSYNSVSEFFKMMNSYSELESRHLLKKRVKFSYSKLFLQPFYNFLVRYFYRFGFLDGWRGFILSYLMAIYHLELWVKIWERTHA
jgi:glycosyltransferase involved in cell wall biosynthesis